MTEKQLNKFLIQTFEKILAEYKEYADYTKDKTGAVYDEINQDYALAIEDLEYIIENIHSVEDLALYEEDFIFEVYQFIQDYADNFIIPAYQPQKAEAEKEYEGLNQILDLFLDDSDS